MQVFVAFNIGKFESVSARARTMYPNGSSYVVGRAIFVATEGKTTKEVATSLGLGDNNVTTGIVIPVTTFWGRSTSELWEWIGAKQRAASGG